jgi:hypothetical protein
LPEISETHFLTSWQNNSLLNLSFTNRKDVSTIFIIYGRDASKSYATSPQNISYHPFVPFPFTLPQSPKIYLQTYLKTNIKKYSFVWTVLLILRRITKWRFQKYLYYRVFRAQADWTFSLPSESESAAAIDEKIAAARHHLLKSLISLHNEHRVLLNVHVTCHYTNFQALTMNHVGIPTTLLATRGCLKSHW